MKKWLKRDTTGLGIFLGIVLPAVLFFVIRGGLHLLEMVVDQASLQFHYALLLSTTINLLTLRYYLVNLKYEKTGRGILAVTFVYIILYFVFFHQ
jgi:hypothetical protein